MQIVEILRLIPHQFRRKFIVVTTLSLLGRLFDLLGLASLLPLVIILLDPSSVQGDSTIGRLFRYFDLDSLSEFGLIIGACLLLWLPLKSLLTIWINKLKFSYLMSLYRYYSFAIYDIYHQRGLLYIKKSHSSELSVHINGACNAFAVGVIGTIINAISEIFTALLLVGVVLVAAPMASLWLSLAIVPLLSIYLLLVRRRLKNLGKESYEIRQKQARVVQESLKGYVSITVNGAQDVVRDEFQKGLQDISKNSVTNSIYTQLPSLLLQLCVAIALMIMLFVTNQTSNSVSMFILFGFVASRMMPLMLNISLSWNNLQSAGHVIDVVAEIKSNMQPSKRQSISEIEPMSFEREIRIEGLSFAYDESNPIFEELSLTINKGEVVGFRGSSGSGKSTLFSLLLGLYSPDKGTVSIDGVRLEPSNRAQWHKIVGYAEQSVYISSSSLAQNVAMGCERDDQKLLAVLEQVGLKEWFDSLPLGLNTPMGEAGDNLSGGERQRLGLARVLYRDAKVLFLDEVTSALDVKNEDNILSVLRDLTQQRDLTVLIISHRESLLSVCDRVINISQ